MDSETTPSPVLSYPRGELRKKSLLGMAEPYRILDADVESGFDTFGGIERARYASARGTKLWHSFFCFSLLFFLICPLLSSITLFDKLPTGCVDLVAFLPLPPAQ